AEQLLEGTGAVLERLLRIVSDLSGDSLEALIHLTKRVDRGIEAVLAHPLKLFTKLLNVGHLTTSLGPAYAGMLRMKIHMGCDGALHNALAQNYCTAQRRWPWVSD